MSTDRFTVSLERVFHGPMDLLLHLVREQEVEIQDVEISSVVEGYLEYLEHLKEEREALQVKLREATTSR